MTLGFRFGNISSKDDWEKGMSLLKRQTYTNSASRNRTVHHSEMKIPLFPSRNWIEWRWQITMQNYTIYGISIYTKYFGHFDYVFLARIYFPLKRIDVCLYVQYCQNNYSYRFLIDNQFELIKNHRRLEWGSVVL